MALSISTPGSQTTANPLAGVTLCHANMYKFDASLPDIFGADATPGRTLLEAIIHTYKVTCLHSFQTVDSGCGCGLYFDKSAKGTVNWTDRPVP